jgi:hypothetical protein
MRFVREQEQRQLGKERAEDQRGKKPPRPPMGRHAIGH